MRQIDTRGSMPFAVVAVALMLAATVLAATAYQYGRADDDTAGIAGDAEAMDDAVADITVHVNRGLGEIVRRISTASDGRAEDTLDERAETFHERTAEWMGRQFPIVSGGVVARLVSYNIDLAAEAMQVSSLDGADGYTPTYLRGTGTVEVALEASSGRGGAVLEISTDGSYALPLAAERGSLFEAMAGGDGISVSEMMSYQLTSLAQYRVLNGYGGTEKYGERGTSAVITEEDVRKAYANCLEVLEMVCFRDADNRFASAGSVDLADLLAADSGRIELDLSAIYAQALMAVVDDVALRWFDYFCGFQVLDALERALMPFRSAVGSLMAFLLGDEAVYSAVPYVERTMASAGIPESAYRHPGSGTTTVTVSGITVSVENPTFDIHSAGWLRDFGRRYSQDTNFIMDFIHDVLRNAAISISESGSLGTVSADVDAFDATSFADTLSELFEAAAYDGSRAVDEAVRASLGSTAIYDPYYGAIANEISAHAEEMTLSAELEDRIRSAFADAVPEDSDVTVADLEGSGELERALRQYALDVRSDLGCFDAMRRVEGERGVVKEVLSAICAYGLDLLGITGPVPAMAEAMCSEIRGNLAMNPYADVIGLPGATGFTVDDGSGNVTVERISADVTSTLIVGSVGPWSEGCVHTVGFGENLDAAYTTVFRVELNDVIGLELTGAGAMAEAMGKSSSVLRQDVESGIVLEIPVASGWPLAGVEYRPSTTVIDDAVALLMEILEPLVEPLREVMEMMRSVLTVLSEALVEALTYVSEQLARIYEAIIEPLTRLKEWLEDAAESLVTETAFAVLINMSVQQLEVSLLGCTFTISTKAITWASNTKTLFTAELTMPVAGHQVTAGITAKVRGDVKAENLIITGFGGVEAEDWSFDATLDPLMKGSRYLVTIDGEYRGTDISLVAPRLENYHEMGVALSDVPGIGDIVSNIPVMGVNVGLDAGFSLKYADPQDFGVIINEFETNPPGEDRGNEWIELYNNSLSTVDLTGYTLTAISDRKTKVMALTGEIAPGEFLVIEPTFTLVNSSGKYTKNGEAVVLKDADGNELDRTPTKKDSANDAMTWQRAFDGSTEWVFAEGTRGRTNDAFPGAKWVSAAELKDTVWSAVERSFDKVENITDLESLQAFLQYMVRYTLEGLINVVSGKIVEASVFVSVDVKDATSSVSTGVRVALRTDGDLVEDVLRYIVGKVMELALNAKNPYRIDPVGMFAENIDLEVTVHTGVGFPELLSRGADLPEMDLGVTFRTNISAISRVLGADTGRPEVTLGIRAIDCPEAAIPSRLSAKDGMDHDLWLMLLTVRFE